LSLLKVGVIGCGEIARTVHIPLLARMRDVRIAALADTDSRSLDYAAKSARTAAMYSSGRDLLDAGQVDAVVIATPTACHAGDAIDAFKAGVNVYLEKPVSQSVECAHALAVEWKRSNKIGAVGLNYRFNPLYRSLRGAIAAGDAGEPQSIETTFAVPLPRIGSWRSARSSGGGALLDLATHHVDLIRFLARTEVASVSAVITSTRTEHDSAVLELRLINGMSARVCCVYSEHFSDAISVQGSRAMLTVDRARSHKVDTSRDAIRFPTPARIRHIVAKLRSPLNEPSYSRALTAFAKACRGETQAFPDIADGLAALNITDAAERSALTGLPVAVG
jgi:predicted dehydrogenase